MKGPVLRGYYAILDVRASGLALGASTLESERQRAEELLSARPCCLQLRAKQLPAGDLLALARALVESCRRAGIPFCVNDRLDVALMVGADAVHVGQEDLPLDDVRAVLASVAAARQGRPLWIGVSTHDLGQARAAEAGGADYIGFGPVFPTASKLRPDPVVGLDGLAQVTRQVALPVVAIGGITRASLSQVIAAGASAAAVIGDIDTASHRLAAAREVAAAFGSIHA